VSIVGEMARALADALARAIAASDARAARMALNALGALVAGLPDASGSG
jgi:hypothetical protein